MLRRNSGQPNSLAILLAVDDDIGTVLVSTDVVDEHYTCASRTAVGVVTPEERGSEVLLEFAGEDGRADAAARVAVSVGTDEDQEGVRVGVGF